MILERIPETEMIILYGSYATGKYVERDTRIEFGTPTTFMSDYDILVVTKGIKNKPVQQKLDAIEDIYYTDPEEQTPVQFINEDIDKLNKDLSEGRYFYTQLKKEGIYLHNSGNCKLARRRKLRFDEIQQQAKEYYDEQYQSAFEFLELTKYAYKHEWYKKAAFNLHQTCESLFNAVRLTFTLKSTKQHNLYKLLAAVKKYSDQFYQIFPQETKEEKRLFKLIKDAYVEARYNPKFVVTKEDIDAFMPLADRLLKLVKELCENRIREYGEMK